MICKILITGPPRSGKTTLIKRLVSYYSKKNYLIEGFLTPEVLDNEQRIGFDLLNIRNGRETLLARKGSYNTGYRLGKYKIFIKNLNNFIKINFQDIEKKKVDLIIIDEIGIMELFSKYFQDFIKKIFRLNINLIGTIGKKLKHPIKNYVRQVQKLQIFELRHHNNEKVFNRIISIIN